MAHPRFKISRSSDGQYTFNLTAANGEIILSSERYTSKEGAKTGVNSVKVNAPNDERYDKRDATNGQYYFVLKAANHEVIGTSETYKAAAGRDNGIQAVKKNAPIAPLEE